MRNAQDLVIHIEGLLPIVQIELAERKEIWDQATFNEFRMDCTNILASAGDYVLFGGYKNKKLCKRKSNVVSEIPEHQKLIQKWDLQTPTNALVWVVALLLDHKKGIGDVGPLKLFEHEFLP